MTRLVRSLALLLLITSLPALADIVRVKVDDTIQPISEEYIARGIDEAARVKADAVLIELRTPGGLGDSMRGIVEKMLASPVPVIVYVAPSGSRAASAGFFILVAADVAAMAPGTNTGAAHPVVMGIKIDEVMSKKLENDAAAFLRSYVSKRGRNVEVAETAVRESKSWTDQEALDQKLIDLVAPTTEELLKRLDGREVTRFDGKKTMLRVAGKRIVDWDMTLRERVLSVILDPNVAFALFIVGMLLVFIEMKAPGTIAPGAVGVALILTSIFAFQLLPLRYAGVGLIVLGVALFILEAKFTSHGLLGAGGTVAMVLGALLLVDAPIPEMRIKLATALAVTLPFAVISVLLATLVFRAHHNKVTTGEQGLIGEVGVARTQLAPAGKVFVHGELWDASSHAPVATGEYVVVRHVDGLRLEVEPVGTAPERSGRS